MDEFLRIFKFYRLDVLYFFYLYFVFLELDYLFLSKLLGGWEMLLFVILRREIGVGKKYYFCYGGYRSII